VFDKVLVGVADSNGGADVAALAKVLAAPGAQLTLAHVYSERERVWAGSEFGAPLLTDEQERQTQLMLQDVGAAVGVDAKSLCIYERTAGRGLHELAQKLGADLLVVGSSRRGFLGRVLLGDDTHAALVGAPCAIAIAPSGFAEHAEPPRRIGVGFDGSPESERALELARALAERYNAQLAALEVVAVPASPRGLSLVPIPELVDAARERVAALEGVEPHAAFGPPADALGEFSGSVGLLVVGSRGYGPLGRLIFGSTSAKLARLARCPLLVLPRSAGPTTTQTSAAVDRGDVQR